MGGECSVHWEMVNKYNIFLGTLKGKRLLGRPRRR